MLGQLHLWRPAPLCLWLVLSGGRRANQGQRRAETLRRRTVCFRAPHELAVKESNRVHLIIELYWSIFIYLITLVTNYFTDLMLHQNNCITFLINFVSSIRCSDPLNLLRVTGLVLIGRYRSKVEVKSIFTWCLYFNSLNVIWILWSTVL